MDNRDLVSVDACVLIRVVEHTSVHVGRSSNKERMPLPCLINRVCPLMNSRAHCEGQ